MAHKKKDAPRKLYARAKVPFVCFAGQYWAPELRADGNIKLENGDVSIEEVRDEDENLIALDGTQTLADGTTVTERMTPFTFERKQRKPKAESESNAESTETVVSPESESTEHVTESTETLMESDSGDETAIAV